MATMGAAVFSRTATALCVRRVRLHLLRLPTIWREFDGWVSRNSGYLMWPTDHLHVLALALKHGQFIKTSCICRLDVWIMRL